MKRHLFNLLLLTALVVSLSACRTSVPRLDYKALAALLYAWVWTSEWKIITNFIWRRPSG